MFFLVSKLIAFLTLPLTWIVALVLFAVFTKRKTRRKRFLIAAASIFVFFTNAVILDIFMGAWEVDGKRPEEIGHYDVAVVLGGMTEWDSNLDRISFRRGSDRLWQAVSLYKMGKVSKVLISGANGSIYEDELVEADQLKDYLVSLGLPEEDIISENESRNTHENALFTANLLREEYPELKTILLVTSGSHMRRARACFRNQDLEVETYSTDLYTGDGVYITFERLIFPNIETMAGWNALIHEMTGYVVYGIMGYI
jgi:uncharacterized SAM-binding protein YcdF (DUF218 family)